MSVAIPTKIPSAAARPGGANYYGGADTDAIIDVLTRCLAAAQPDTITSATTLDDSHGYVRINASSSFDVTIPDAATYPGKVYILKRIDTDATKLVNYKRTGSVNTFDSLAGPIAIQPGGVEILISDSANKWDRALLIKKELLDSVVLRSDLDNALGAHYFSLSEIAIPATPAAGVVNFFVDSADNHAKIKRSTGATVDLESTAGGGADVTSTIPASVSTTDYQTAINTAGTNGKLRGHGGQTLSLTSPLRLNLDAGGGNDGVEIDMQGLTLKPANSWSGGSDDGLLMIDLLGASNTTTKITIRNGQFEQTSADGTKGAHGITNSGDFGSNTDERLKFTLIHDCIFAFNKTGKHYIYLINVENQLEINHCELDGLKSSAASRSYGIWLRNWGHNGGNVAITFCKISLGGQTGATDHGTSDSGWGIYIQADTSPFNRCFIIGNHLFVNNSHINARGIYLKGEGAGGGGSKNNRTHIIGYNGIEDFKIGIELLGVAAGSGIDGVIIIANGIENKNDGAPGEYENATLPNSGVTPFGPLGDGTTNALIKVGAKCNVHIHSCYLMVQTGAGNAFTSIEFNSAETESSMIGCQFVRKAGTGTWTKVGGSNPSVLWKRAVHNIGFRTEGTWISSVLSDSAGERTFSITHDLDIDPDPQDVKLSVYDANANTAWRYNTLVLWTATATQITGKLHITTGGAGGASPQVIAQVRRDF